MRSIHCYAYISLCIKNVPNTVFTCDITTLRADIDRYIDYYYIIIT